MLATVANIWWSRLHREVVGITQTCQQRKTGGKILEPLLRQSQKRKFPECKEVNKEIAIDFAGPFQNAIKARKSLLISIDHYSGWLEANFFTKTKHQEGN